jgi:DNA/RNA-binding domain of Phe-tRNA-synthetase-like protein
MIDINISEHWRNSFPGAHIGFLLIENINNAIRFASLEERKKKIELSVREKYAGYTRADLLQLNPLSAYKRYYKKFDNTYHVQLQLESVAHKGKSLPNVSPLVDAAFASEMETLLLTAGHDADLLDGRISVDVTSGTEIFVQMNGKSRTVKANDMMMKDESGVVCTILHGQDKRTPISPLTRRVLYVTYVPEGIIDDAVHSHLNTLKANVLLFAPESEVKYQEVHSA